MSAEEIKELKVKRGIIKSQLTNFKTFIDNITEDKFIQLPERLTKCEELWGRFDLVQGQLESLDGKQCDERFAFEDNYYDIISVARKKLNEHSLASVNLNQSVGSQGTIRTGVVKLPPISLPNFDGKYEQWVQFYDTFRSLVHSDTSLSDMQKLFYLKSCLKGEAAEILSSLEVTGANYTIAWSLLQDRYEHKRLIIHNHIKALFELQPITKESLPLLRKLQDDVKKNIRALAALGQPTDQWDSLLIYLVASKLDNSSKREWEKLVIEHDYSTIDKIYDFLTQRCQLLEAVHSDRNKEHGSRDKLEGFKNRRFFKGSTPDQGVRALHAADGSNERSGVACYLCKGSHFLIRCKRFLDSSIKVREREVKRMKLCLNCLRANHATSECVSGGCRKCNKMHNSLLHQEGQDDPGKQQGANNKNCNERDEQQNQHIKEKADTVLSNVVNCQATSVSEVLLSTALVHIADNKNKLHECRVLLDSGSQSNFISAKMCRDLSLDVKTLKIPVVGINQCVTNTSFVTETTIRSKFNNFQVSLPLIVIDKVTGNLPSNRVNKEDIKIPKNIILADETFSEPREIDVLLGATVFWELLCVGQIKLNKNQPVIQKTKLGWIISGSIPRTINNSDLRTNSNRTVCNLSTFSIQDQIERFWKVEECLDDKIRLSTEEQECERLFLNTTIRREDGHFEVKLPVRENIQEIGESYETAEKRFLQLERRFRRNKELKEKYSDFVQEYLDMEHMSRVKNGEHSTKEVTYYMPHHGVSKEESETTKLRVVFNASEKTSSGISLNDKLKIGPTLQDDLFSILVRFRTHNYVLTGDIAKMYRMIYVAPDQRSLQSILWRFSEDQPIEKYQLNTVTYGTACASYLAIRSLQQVAHENKEKYPDTSKKILSDFYVDDLLTGASTIEEAKCLRDELAYNLNQYGFNLRKWMSNSSDILSDLSDIEQVSTHLIAESQTTKTLGLTWDSSNDTLSYSVCQNDGTKATKRNVLSTIAQIFDPLGLIGPCVIKAKIIMQKLWALGLKWDETLPLDLHGTWNRFYGQLQDLNQLRVPRQAFCFNTTSFQLHGFSDSSEMAYAACIYVRSTNSENKHFIRLLTAKSRVAPLKKITLPKLELCGALLLSRLMSKVSKALSVNSENVYYYTDSTIVLGWILTEPHLMKTFVANRIVEIQQLTFKKQWRHVSGKENPADILTRGLNPDQLASSQLWWNGPPWLAQSEETWTRNFIYETFTNLPELKTIETKTFFVSLDNDIFERYSTLLRLERVVALIIRFATNSRTRRDFRTTGPLTVEELQFSLKCLIKLAQHQQFGPEIRSLQAKENINSTSALLPLNPFLDQEGILRVGGRLKRGNLPFDIKHQIILPNKHKLTQLIVECEHRKNLHAGPQTLLAILRQQFWPIAGKNIIKGVLHRCMVCYKTRPFGYEHIMGDLPKNRITPSRPFSICGLDYAGPFEIKTSKLRKAQILKAYVCVFVCFATKAIHIEVVSDLTTDCFLNCLKRFVSRRGKPAHIYSDNGTNFVGAKNALYEFFEFLNDRGTQDVIFEMLLRDSIVWHLIPPRSPHFGGLWESAVKSVKGHLKRVIGTTTLTFEELLTLMTQIEAVLNSRPLTPMSQNPEDLTFLTPGHFLIGDSLMALPQAELLDINPNRLTRFQHLTQIMQHFWCRWSSEYLTSLQQRNKWASQEHQAIQIGDMVLLKDENLPPMKWSLGRVKELFPGADGVTRVVNVKTMSGVFKRAIRKLCPLPLYGN